MRRKQKVVLWLISVMLLMGAIGCRKKVPIAVATPVPPPAPIEAPKPTPPVIADFSVDPGRIDRGQSAQLRWHVKDAAQIEINQGIGTVTASGQRQIRPTESTTYTLTAKGPGGNAAAEATLSVTLPPPLITAPPTAAPTIGERLSSEVIDALFDYDRSNLRDDAREALVKDAAALRTIMSDFPDTTVIIEGHCDERGSAEYNLGLGDRRASAAKDLLTQLGVPGDRLIKISYGKERPQCVDSNEGCWQRNRRVHFVPGESARPKVISQSTEGGDR